MSFVKNIWKSNAKHHKLSEDVALHDAKKKDESEPVEALEDANAVTFKLKYLGSTVIEKMLGDNAAHEAVKSILKSAKTHKKKPQRVNFSVHLKGVEVTDSNGEEILKISIYRISNCCTNPSHPQIFSFTSTDSDETTNCHAFSCSKRKFAETVALTVAHAFTTAYQEWRILPKTKQFESSMESHGKSEKSIPAKIDDKREVQLICFEEDEKQVEIPVIPKFKYQPVGTSDWVSFEDDFKPLSVF